MNDLDSMWVRLVEADGAGDPEEVAKIAWQLYADLGQARADNARLRASLHDMATRAARGLARAPA